MAHGPGSRGPSGQRKAPPVAGRAFERLLRGVTFFLGSSFDNETGMVYGGTVTNGGTITNTGAAANARGPAHDPRSSAQDPHEQPRSVPQRHDCE
jgi:hypothetical protein